MSRVLVINSGSSSMKYQLIEPESGSRDASGLIERIGEPLSRLVHRRGAGAAGTPVRPLTREVPVPDHRAGFSLLLEAFAETGIDLARILTAVGHRVVQGGPDFVAPVRIDDRAAARILELSELAPLHNPGHSHAIRAAREAFPEVPHVAVFDTAFHQQMPAANSTYAIDPEVADRFGVRRYGFHGTSYEVVSRRAARLLDRPVDSLRQIVLHLGNGASMCAIDRGRSVATSMGLTPLEGLVMGSRSGDIDPGALLHLLRSGLSVDELDELLNHRSGLLGMTGSGDMRDVRAEADAGSPRARRALEVYVARLRHYLGAYLVELGSADAIVFTAGIGENDSQLRHDVCAGLEWLGIRIDSKRNDSPLPGPRGYRVSADDSRVAVLVVPTDEEAEIARQTWDLITGDEVSRLVG